MHNISPIQEMCTPKFLNILSDISKDIKLLHQISKNENDKILHGYSNADWAKDKFILCFTLDYCFILINEVASWGSKKQQLVVTSYFVSSHGGK